MHRSHNRSRKGGDAGDWLPMRKSGEVNPMTPSQVSKVESYLRRTLDTDVITIHLPSKRNAPIEVFAQDEFICGLHGDEEDVEVSDDLHISVLAEDLE